MSTKYSKHSEQGALLQPLSNKDVCVVDVVDSSTESGYTTANIDLDLYVKALQNYIRGNPTTPTIVVEKDGFLKGDGSTGNPLEIDLEAISKVWVRNGYSNVTQIGKFNTNLPITVTDNGSVITLQITKELLCHVCGVTFKLKTGTHTGTKRNVTHIYLLLSASGYEILFSDAIRPESQTTVYLATYRGTTLNQIKAVLRIDTTRITLDRQGGSMPATTGIADRTKHIPWGFSKPVKTNCGINTGLSTGLLSANHQTHRITMQTTNVMLYMVDKQKAVSRYGRYYISAMAQGDNTYAGVSVNGTHVLGNTGSTYAPVDITDYLVNGNNTLTITSPAPHITIIGVLYIG